MNDFQNIERKKKIIEKYSNKKIKDIDNIYKIINFFKKSMELLKDNIKSVPNIIDEPLNSLNNTLNNFIELLEKNLALFDHLIFNNLNIAKEKMKQNSIIFNEISKEKKNLKIENNNKKIDSEKEISFNNAVKEKNKLICTYKLNNMYEMIDENNTNSTNMIKESLIQFCNTISNYIKMIDLLNKEITNIIENIKNYNLEEIIKREEEKKINEENKIGSINRNKNDKNVKKEKNINNTNKNKIDTSEIHKNTKDDNEKNEQYINDLIKKLILEKEEIETKEICNLFNIIENTDNKNKKNKYSNIILNSIHSFCKNTIIYVKNKENLIHLSNIVNTSFNDKNDINLFKIIVEISQKIAFQKIFLYRILKNKNKFFTTQEFWKMIINDCLIKEIIKHTKDKSNKKKVQENEDKEKGIDNEKENNIKEFLKIIDPKRKIKELNKLNKNQKKEIYKFIIDNLYKMISKYISEISSFLPNKEIKHLLNYYFQYVEKNQEEKLYLQNKAKVKYITIINKKVFCKKNERPLTNKLIIISSVSKFLKMNEYLKLITLNKQISKRIKKYIFLNILSNDNLKINSHLKLWHECLKINEIKNTYKYLDIKKGIDNAINQGQIGQDIKVLKNMEVIEQDLKRTDFVQKNPEHYNSIKSILNCFLLTIPNIGYCQGLNCLVSFLYQLLNNDEEKTFYFLCGLEINTDYHIIFEDNFRTLTNYFGVFDEILKINKPEVYYKLKKNNLFANHFTPSWFITLFTQDLPFFEDNSYLLIIFIFEHFMLKGWSAIFNFGYMLIEYIYEKIKEYDKEKLIAYMMNFINEENIFNNENYQKCKNIYLKNEPYINSYLIDKLTEIGRFESNHK